MSSSDRGHPVFAALFDRMSRSVEKRGMGRLRRELLSGAHGFVVEIGAGTGLNFAHYPGGVTEVVATEHLELARQMVSRKVLSGAATVYELDIVTKDGRRVPLEVSTRLMLREGKPVAVQGIARDIRERRRIETERAELLTRE